MPSPEDSASISAWLEAIHQAIKDHAESVAKYQQSEQSDRQQQSQTGLNAVVRLPMEVTEYYRAEQGERPVKNRNERIRIALEIVGVITAILLAILTFRTLFVFNGQLIEMQKQTKILQQQAIESASYYAQQLVIASQQVKAAQDSVIATQRQMRQDQRAWIGASVGIIPNTPPIIAPITIINTGKTAARNVHAEFDIVIVKNGESPSFSETKWEETTGIMFPNAPVPMKAVLLRPGPLASMGGLTSTDVAGLQAGTLFYEVYGSVTYLDVFNIPHWLHFCRFASPIDKIAIVSADKCTRYNDADNNQEPPSPFRP